MIPLSQLTTQWKDASPLDQRARQINLFLFSKRRPIARLKSDEISDASLTLWRENDYYVLVYLTPRDMKPEDVALILSSLEEMALHGISTDKSFSNLLINIFARKFQIGFISKLRFLSVLIQTYEWFVSDDNQKETILVKEITSPPREEHEKKMAVDKNEVVFEAPNDVLTSEELAAFVQLGMDLRKIR